MLYGKRGAAGAVPLSIGKVVASAQSIAASEHSYLFLIDAFNAECSNHFVSLSP